MATVRFPRIDREQIPKGKSLISYDEALSKLDAAERLQATVYAVNTLLIAKGVYSAEEFQFQFRQSAQKQLRKRQQG